MNGGGLYPPPPPHPHPPWPGKPPAAPRHPPLAASEAEIAIEWTRVLGILAVGATLIIGDLLERHHIHILPEAAVGVLIGALCAAMTSYLDDDAMLDDERFNFYVFTDYLLPPISALPRHPPVARRMCLATERSSLCVCTVFEAGYNMQSRPFFANLGPTCFFAFVGTFTSAVVVGGLVYVAGQLGLCYPLGGLASLTFGRRHCLHPYHRRLLSTSCCHTSHHRLPHHHHPLPLLPDPHRPLHLAASSRRPTR